MHVLNPMRCPQRFEGKGRAIYLEFSKTGLQSGMNLRTSQSTLLVLQ